MTAALKNLLNPRAFGDSGIPWSPSYPPRKPGGLFEGDDEGFRASMAEADRYDADERAKANVLNGQSLEQLQTKYPGLQGFSMGKARPDTDNAAAVRQILAGGHRNTLDDPGADRREAEWANRQAQTAQKRAFLSDEFGLDPRMVPDAVRPIPTRQESAEEDAYIDAQVGKAERDEAHIAAARNAPTFDPYVYQLEQHAKRMEATARMQALEEQMRQMEYRKRYYEETGRIPNPEDDKMSDERYRIDTVRELLAQVDRERAESLARLATLPEGPDKQAAYKRIEAKYDRDREIAQSNIRSINRTDREYNSGRDDDPTYQRPTG